MKLSTKPLETTANVTEGCMQLLHKSATLFKRTAFNTNRIYMHDLLGQEAIEQKWAEKRELH